MFVPYPYHTGGSFRFLPASRVEVRSEVEGLVDKVLVHEGEWVKAGQPIARLSGRTQERNLKSSQAKLEEARAQLQLLKAGPRPEEIERARADVSTAETSLAWSGPRAERYAELHRQNLVSDQEYENAVRQRDIDTAMLEEAKANLRLVQSGARREQIQALEAEIRSLQALADNSRMDVESATLRSPIAGWIVTPRVEELAGTYLKPGQRDLVVQIEDARTIRAEVEVPEEEVMSVSLGAGVEVAPWAFHDVSFKGTVVSIAPVAATNSAEASTTVQGPSQAASQVAVSASTDRVVRVITEIPNPDGVLKTDMTGYAKIATGHRPVWDVLFRPIIRWLKVRVWYWIP
jgi:putative peptide zinc metalloprotease protein